MSEFNIDRLRNIVLQMKLPIAFDVLNSLDSNDTGEPYIVVINDIPSRIHFRRIYDFRYKEEFGMAPFPRWMRIDMPCYHIQSSKFVLMIK